MASEIVDDSPQRDGRRHIRERHVDHLGRIYECSFLAEIGVAANAQLASRVAQLDVDNGNREVEANESNALEQIAPTFNYSTVAQFRTRLRQRFQTSGQWDAVRLGKFIQSLALTDAQLKTLFGVNDAQLPALKTKLSALATKFNDVTAQVGQ